MTFDEKYFDIGRLDRLSYQETFVHRLDPRAKVIATMLFLLTVISFPKYEIVALAPFFLFPVLLMTIGEIPVRFIIRKISSFHPSRFSSASSTRFWIPGPLPSSPGSPYRRDGSPLFRFS